MQKQREGWCYHVWLWPSHRQYKIFICVISEYLLLSTSHVTVFGFVRSTWSHRIGLLDAVDTFCLKRLPLKLMWSLCPLCLWRWIGEMTHEGGVMWVSLDYRFMFMDSLRGLSSLNPFSSAYLENEWSSWVFSFLASSIESVPVFCLWTITVPEENYKRPKTTPILQYMILYGAYCTLAYKTKHCIYTTMYDSVEGVLRISL